VGRRWPSAGLVLVPVGLVLVAAIAVLGIWRPWQPPVVPAAYRTLVVSAARTCPGLDVHILAAQLDQESHWNPRAVSGGGGQGIAQFLPATWATYGVDGDRNGTKDIWDPKDAIPSAAHLDCVLLEDTRSIPGNRVDLMLAAYNAGLGAVERYHGVPPFSETRAYVQQIVARAKILVVEPSG
jgi:soluble lytic murein transglycosylase-like protein